MAGLGNVGVVPVLAKSPLEDIDGIIKTLGIFFGILGGLYDLYLAYNSFKAYFA